MSVSETLKELVEEIGAETVVEMIDLFLSDPEYRIDKRLSNLRKSLENMNETELAAEAHLLKGSSGNFGAEEIVKLSDSLRRQTRQKNFNEVRKTLEHLDSYVQSFKKELVYERQKYG